tara:strand:- start:4298 stop:4534 length:237 start_codon:yes stop_codon:yes gene_type:complete
MNWRELTQGILNDTLPKDRKKYVKFSNLVSINKKMVLYYLKKGKINKNKRRKCLTGILEEMKRSSNERYDIEDTTKPE